MLFVLADSFGGFGFPSRSFRTLAPPAEGVCFSARLSKLPRCDSRRGLTGSARFLPHDSAKLIAMYTTMGLPPHAGFPPRRRIRPVPLSLTLVKRLARSCGRISAVRFPAYERRGCDNGFDRALLSTVPNASVSVSTNPRIRPRKSDRRFGPRILRCADRSCRRDLSALGGTNVSEPLRYRQNTNLTDQVDYGTFCVSGEASLTPVMRSLPLPRGSDLSTVNIIHYM